MEFKNRKNELEILDNKWADGQAHFVVLYGKKRVGKTALIREFIQDKPALYFLADERLEKDQLAALSQQLGLFFQDSALLEGEGPPLDNWPQIIAYLRDHLQEGHRFVLVLDEYPALCAQNNEVSPRLRDAWSFFLQDARCFVILAGSNIPAMQSEVLFPSSPLARCRTARLRLYPFTVSEARGFFGQDLPFEEFIRTYAVTGGQPAYMAPLAGEGSLQDRVAREIFDPQAFLHREIPLMLQEEFRETKIYFSILAALAQGHERLRDLAEHTGLGKNVLTKYLGVLEDHHIIERELPVTVDRAPASRKGRYDFTDGYYRFWFRYVFPNRSALEMGHTEGVWGQVESTLPRLEALAYRQYCWELCRAQLGELFFMDRLGRWWDKGQEIGLVAFNRDERQILLGEVSWSEEPLDSQAYFILKKKAKLVDWNKKNRTEHLALFSRAGFTPEVLSLAEKENIYLVAGEKVLRGPKALAPSPA